MRPLTQACLSPQPPPGPPTEQRALHRARRHKHRLTEAARQGCGSCPAAGTREPPPGLCGARPGPRQGPPSPPRPARTHCLPAAAILGRAPSQSPPPFGGRRFLAAPSPRATPRRLTALPPPGPAPVEKRGAGREGTGAAGEIFFKAFFDEWRKCRAGRRPARAALRRPQRRAEGGAAGLCPPVPWWRRLWPSKERGV